METLIFQKQTGRHCIVPTRLKTKSSKGLKRNCFGILSTSRHVETTNWILPSIKKCHLSAELDKSFPSIYNLTDHEAIRLSLQNPVTETNPLVQNFRSFGNADYDAINEHLVEEPFQSICYININKMSEEFTWYLDGFFDLYVPKGTRHRQSLPPWISCGTSNLINKL